MIMNQNEMIEMLKKSQMECIIMLVDISDPYKKLDFERIQIMERWLSDIKKRFYLYKNIISIKKIEEEYKHDCIVSEQLINSILFYYSYKLAIEKVTTSESFNVFI